MLKTTWTTLHWRLMRETPLNGIMPRRLEIRTTILEKKSDVRTRGKDANSNDLYADEALQLLEEIQQLKSNSLVVHGLFVLDNENTVRDSELGQQVACAIQKTDEKILGTYVKSPSKRKKKSDVPARKVAYDVLYPAIGKCQPTQ
ncbi:hypothetical protein OUZ56_014867 [Daphnia magna]|uniref:Uncharacterized protein n=1 Tax=Daphnia magna TaxID=35525 RepID=A0ABR0AL29_9CRUS|nr:hypothetical protein OUZ56_014867 [Daphnia magna]